MVKWIKRLLKGAVVLLLAALVAGIGYEQWSRWSVARTVSPSGILYDVDGRRSHLHCSGDGVPTVILEAGLYPGGSLSWSNIYPDLAEGSRVCSYDRAGIMWSQSRDEPRDAFNIANELHALLGAASESPPYVLVGHSLGGVLVRVFDHRFPGEVVGFVFVDSSHPEQNQRLSPEPAEAGLPSPLLIKALSAIGVLRLMYGSSRPEALPEHAAAAFAALFPQSINGAMREIAALDAILDQSAETGPLGDRPIVVLTAGRNPDYPDQLPPGVDRWQKVERELQAELAALSTNSDHRVVPNASHDIHWDEPSAVVVGVHDVVDAVRNGAVVRREDG